MLILLCYVFMYTRIHLCLYACTQPTFDNRRHFIPVYTFVCTHMRTRMHTYTRIHTYQTGGSRWSNARTSARALVRTSLVTYTNTYLHTYTHIHAYKQEGVDGQTLAQMLERSSVLLFAIKLEDYLEHAVGITDICARKRVVHAIQLLQFGLDFDEHSEKRGRHTQTPAQQRDASQVCT